jgi:predicted Rossmann fold flavoprotein
LYHNKTNKDYMQKKFDVIIVGAGAAGLMCAIHLGIKGKRVAILDHNTKFAEKIRISGGGKCNFTNINVDAHNYISTNPYFMISALSRYTPKHFCELLDKYNIGYHEKTLGQLFCNNSSYDIINLLSFLINNYKVQRDMGVLITNITNSPTGFIVNTKTNIQYYSDALVIATGGLALPQSGATGFGYEIAKQFGLSIISPQPALVPLTMSEYDLIHFAQLSGISFSAKIAVNNISFQENVLLTHRGLSGPAILQISSYWAQGQNIVIDILPEYNLVTLLHQHKSSNKLLNNFLQQFISQRLANSICQILQLNKPISQLSNKEIAQLNQFIHNFSITPNGTLGHKKAEVTKGGVATDQLSSKTMMVNNVSGLYFIGEVVDVTGWLGGYNFQWAWSSAVACAGSI